MKSRIAISVFLIFFLGSCSICSEKYDRYYLYTVSKHSDINYPMLSRIDSLPAGIVKLKNEFRPVPGNYTIVRFLSFSYGLRYEHFNSELNNVVVLKLDSMYRIVDGYFYFLQNGEAPCSVRFYKMANHQLSAHGKISLKRFRFEHPTTDIDSADIDYFKFKYKGFLVFPRDLRDLNFHDEYKDSINHVFPCEDDGFVIN